MSRARLRSVQRVAQLREQQARRVFGEANRLVAQAGAEVGARSEALASVDGVAGGGDELRSALQQRALRGDALTVAKDSAERAREARAQALAQWQHERQQAELVGRLVERQRAADEEHRLAQVQRELDDVAAGRSRTARAGVRS